MLSAVMDVRRPLITDIVIGVASVIAMVTVGQGSTAQVQSDVASLGSNLLNLRAGAPGQGMGSGGTSVGDTMIRSSPWIGKMLPISSGTPTSVKLKNPNRPTPASA